MCEVIVSIILSASGTLLFIIPANTATNEFGRDRRVAAVARALWVARAASALLMVRRFLLIPI